MSRNGKGSKPRPCSISYKTYGDNFDDIFRKKANINKTTPTDCHKAECELFIKDQNKMIKSIVVNPNWKVKINIIPNENQN
jgi:hypothetical protein